MHRSIRIIVDSGHSRDLLDELQKLEDVISLSVVREGSLKPPGDVVTVTALNRGADEVWRSAEKAREHGPVSISSSDLLSVVSTSQQERVLRDVDESTWEEMDASLRKHGQITINFLLLMVMGGAVAAAAMVSGPVNEALYVVAASIIAPAFSPLAMISLGIMMRRWHVVRRGLTSVAIGYIALAFGGFAAFSFLSLTGQASVDRLLSSSQVQQIASLSGTDLLTSVLGAVAGMVMITANRDHLLSGPLIALSLVPAGASLGGAIAAGQFGLVDDALRRWAIDAGLVILLGMAILLVKQRKVHRRQMII